MGLDLEEQKVRVDSAAKRPSFLLAKPLRPKPQARVVESSPQEELA